MGIRSCSDGAARKLRRWLTRAYRSRWFPALRRRSRRRAYAGIPLTHRDYASSFTVVTASVADSKDEGAQDWETLAAMPGTLVMLMGWRALGDAAAALIAAGKPTDTPAAVISWGTEPYQKTAVGRLSDIAEVARSRGLSAPATVVIGEVVRLRDRIGWFESLPLLGRRVLVTRARAQAGALSRRLAEMGALPVEAPMIEIRPPEDCSALDAALAEAPKFDWIVFASANAALAVRDRLEANGLDSRALGGVRVASIGGATAGALRGMGIVADLTPASTTASGLADALKAAGVSGKRALLPRSDIAPRRLPDALRAAGAEVTQVVAYQNTLPDSGARRPCPRAECWGGHRNVRKLVGGQEPGRDAEWRLRLVERGEDRVHRPHHGGDRWKVGAES